MLYTTKIKKHLICKNMIKSDVLFVQIDVI